MFMITWKLEIVLGPVNTMRLEDGTEAFYRDYRRENEVISDYKHSDMKTRLV